MIREYAPIGLIPAAWAMTFATMIYPGIDTYWIRHMHYFMLIFLTGFTVLSWKQMGKDPVLDIWRKVIGVGIIFTGLGALRFSTNSYSGFLGGLSLVYWFLTPGIALYYSSKEMNEYPGLYEKLGGESIVGFALFSIGVYSDVISLQMIGIIGIAIVQTISIALASKLDS